MQTIQDIFTRINMLRDNEHIENFELLDYFNSLDRRLVQTLRPTYLDMVIPAESSDIQALPNNLPINSIKAIYLDGVRLLRKKSMNDGLTGWFSDGKTLRFVLDEYDRDAVIQYYSTSIEHELEDIHTDSNLVIPDAYRDLYVYHILAQIASKEDDSSSYQNYKTDYNTCLSEYLATTKREQLYPNLQIKD